VLAAVVIEKGVGIFIPPACREEVLGDLRERNDGAQLFLYDALRTVPFVILSRVRRTTDSVVLLMEAFCCYVSFFTAAWVLQPSMTATREGLLRLAIPGAIALVVLMIADAYADPRKKSLLRPVLAVALAFACVFAVHAGRPLLPGPTLAAGSGMSILFLLVLRMLFPPMADRPQQAQGPAFWQKQEIVAAGVLKATAAIAGILLVGSSVPDHLKAPVLGIVVAGIAIYLITRRT
jgi:drug/metabolite transporter (DMT)-like permease